MKYDVIIVGAGMAGLTAAIYLRRAGKTVLVFERLAYGGQIINTTAVENWPGEYQISGADLMKKVYEQAEKLGAEIRYEETLKIEKEGDLFTVTTDEDEYSAETIILAVGTEPRKLSEKQTLDAGSRPISYCATCDGALYKGKKVVVVGSGNTAKHEMKYLESICAEVFHIHHDDPIPREAEAVFVAIGRVPMTKTFAKLVDLDNNGFIKADDDCKTSCSGVFVAGDCRVKKIRQLVTAAGDGAVVAEAVVDYLK